MHYNNYRKINELPAVRIKAELLSHGLSLSDAFIANYGAPFLEKRRAYGNSDDVSYQSVTVPQELYFGEPRLVCSVNIRRSSEWVLDFDGSYFVRNRHYEGSLVVDFPRRPVFYGETLESGVKSSSIATLYGGGALGIFVYGNCALVDAGQACQYCSIQVNRSVQTEFEEVVKPSQIYDVIRRALLTDGDVITQVMINGGNFKDSDKSFRYYVDICEKARAALDDADSNAELHLIAYPPKDLSILAALAEHRVSIAMNSEVFDPVIFSEVCPGKSQSHLRAALVEAVRVLGKGNVYSILVGGLEPLSSLSEGIKGLGSEGVTPVINVFHPDPGTPLEGREAPSVEEVMDMGALLQDLYSKYSFMVPFYSGCGRNAIDTEAYLGLFVR